MNRVRSVFVLPGSGNIQSAIRARLVPLRDVSQFVFRKMGEAIIREKSDISDAPDKAVHRVPTY